MDSNIPSLDIKIPELKDIYKDISPDANYANVDKTVRAAGSMPSITSLVLPALKDLLAPQGKALESQISGNIAGVQSDMMKRGLEGSDIEAAGMMGARSAGNNAFAQLYSHFGDQIMQMVTGDLNMNRENLMALAQLMGQKITSDQDLQLFREQISAGMEQASMNRNAQLWSAGIGAIGSIAGGAARGAMTPTSDRRLKQNIKPIDKVGGVNIYRYDWTPEARMMGMVDEAPVGVLAQEVERSHPHAIVRRDDGYLAVDYTKLPIAVLFTVARHGVRAGG